MEALTRLLDGMANILAFLVWGAFILLWIGLLLWVPWWLSVPGVLGIVAALVVEWRGQRRGVEMDCADRPPCRR